MRTFLVPQLLFCGILHMGCGAEGNEPSGHANSGRDTGGGTPGRSDGGGVGGQGDGGFAGASDSGEPHVTVTRGHIDGYGLANIDTAVDSRGVTRLLAAGTRYALVYGECAANCALSANWKTVKVSDNGLSNSVHAPRLVLALDDTVHALFSWLHGVVYATCRSECLKPANWVSTALAEGIAGTVPNWAHRTIQIAPSGTLWAVYGAKDGRELLLRISACDTACTNARNWKWVNLNIPIGIGGLSFALTSKGAPRILIARSDNHSVSYLQCDTQCMGRSSWTTVNLFVGNEQVALALDEEDRPRIVFNQGHVGGKNASTDWNLYYAACDSQCRDAANWRGFKIGEQYDGRSGLSVALVGPGILVAAGRLELRESDGIILFECTADCGVSASWRRSVLETVGAFSAEHPPPAPANGYNPIWYISSPVISINAINKALQIIWEVNESWTEYGGGVGGFDFLAQVMEFH